MTFARWKREIEVRAMQIASKTLPRRSTVNKTEIAQLAREIELLATKKYTADKPKEKVTGEVLDQLFLSDHAPR